MIPVVWLILNFGGAFNNWAVSIPEPDLNTCQAVAQQARLQPNILSALCYPGVR